MTEAQSILVLGGCKSGKSAYALNLARDYPAENRIYIATCMAHDQEMQDRIARHRQERGPEWQTVEEPYQLCACIAERSGPGTVLLADCLTLWLSNLLQQGCDEQHLREHFFSLQQTVSAVQGSVILVSNEVGCGIVPEHRLARQFRDLAGLLNQHTAAAVKQVYWTVAGIPVRIK